MGDERERNGHEGLAVRMDYLTVYDTLEPDNDDVGPRQRDSLCR
jgi:hypothetical protein